MKQEQNLSTFLINHLSFYLLSKLAKQSFTKGEKVDKVKIVSNQ
jgi:hypothetical protein